MAKSIEDGQDFNSISPCKRPIDYFLQDQNGKSCHQQLDYLFKSKEREWISNSVIENQRKLKNVISPHPQSEFILKQYVPDFNRWPSVSHMESPFWQNQISKILTHIIESHFTRTIDGFCRSLPIASYQFAFHFGLRDLKLAERLQKLCISSTKGNSQNWFGNQLSMKEYIIVQAPDSLKLSGWTNEVNTTYLFINSKTTWADLVHAIIHEMAIGKDGKLISGLSEELARARMFSNLDQETYNELKALIELSFTPEIAYTFATFRANQMAQSILAEDSSGTFDSVDHWSKVKSIYQIASVSNKLIFKTSESTEKDQLPNDNFSQIALDIYSLRTHSLIQNARLKYPSFDENLKRIIGSKTLFPIGPNQELMTYFNYLTIPKMGDNTAQTMATNGPGCGYCGTSYQPEQLRNWNSFWNNLLEPHLNNESYKNEE